MVEAIYYQDIFLCVVTCCTFCAFLRYNSYAGIIVENKNNALFLAIALALFIGFRPVHDVFADTVGYAAYYNFIKFDAFQFNQDTENLIFDNLFAFTASQGFSNSTFFLVIALIYFVFRYISCRKMFPDNTWVSYVVFLGAFLTFTSSVNGIKAGAAASLFMCAIAYKDNKPLSILFLLLSWGFHHSMIICIVAFITVSLNKITRLYYLLWIISFAIAALHITLFQYLFAEYINDKGASYLYAKGGWLTGMRYDFALYSAAPILLSWWCIEKHKIKDETYRFIVNIYVLLNSLWLLCMYASFTNRIAALSWFLYPVVLIYPFLSKNIHIPYKNYTLSWIVLGHLCFTLFMHFIYYHK